MLMVINSFENLIPGASVHIQLIMSVIFVLTFFCSF